MKHNVGEEVYLFNSMSLNFEKDMVYGVLFVPIPKDGVAQSEGQDFATRLRKGQMEVKEQCQTVQHQIVDADLLFKSEQECRDFYRNLLVVE